MRRFGRRIGVLHLSDAASGIGLAHDAAVRRTEAAAGNHRPVPSSWLERNRLMRDNLKAGNGPTAAIVDRTLAGLVVSTAKMMLSTPRGRALDRETMLAPRAPVVVSKARVYLDILVALQRELIAVGVGQASFGGNTERQVATNRWRVHVNLFLHDDEIADLQNDLDIEVFGSFAKGRPLVARDIAEWRKDMVDRGWRLA